MSLLRKIIFWCHLSTGVTAGLIVLIMSVTGVLLTYERQIIAWADTSGYSSAPPSAEAARLSVETILAKVSDESNAMPSSVIVRADPAAPVSVSFGRERTFFVNAYTGESLGEGASNVRSFFRVVTDWHRWLGANGENRVIARAITGACNLGFLFLVVSGFYLWWPRKWTWPLVKNVLWFKRGLAGKSRDFNWHNVFGFWASVPLFIVVLSAVVISYPWASNLVYRVVGETPPAPRPAQATPAGAAVRREEVGRADRALLISGLDGLWARAREQAPQWNIITMQVPTSVESPVTFAIDEGNGGQPQKRAQLTLDRRTSEIVQWEPFSSYSSGRQLRSILRFAHTGEVAGVAGQTIAGIASLAAAALVWTGLALAWRRSRAWARRRTQAKVGEQQQERPPASTARGL